jgi:hypothetical protein
MLTLRCGFICTETTLADEQTRADARLEEALEASGARDPREFYRDWLRRLREQDRGLYEKAVTHYRRTLLPSIVEQDADPLAAWTEYGRTLAQLAAPGRTLCVDGSGLAQPYTAPSDPADLVLHLPDGRRGKALTVGLPRELTAAQRATFDWLVQGRTTLKEAP